MIRMTRPSVLNQVTRKALTCEEMTRQRPILHSGRNEEGGPGGGQVSGEGSRVCRGAREATPEQFSLRVKQENIENLLVEKKFNWANAV